MDVTRYTYTPLNPYQGPREAGERADLLLPGLGGKGHQAAMLGLDQTWMAVSLTPRWRLPLTPPVRATNLQQPSAQQGSNGHGRTVVTHTGPPVGLTGGIPKWQRLSPICPQRRARHARRAAGFWLPARSPEQQVRPAPIWGSSGAPRCPVTSRGPLTNHQLPPRYGLAGQRRIDSGTAGPELVMTASAALTGPGPSDQLSDNRARDTRMTVDSETPCACSDDKQDRSQDCSGPNGALRLANSSANRGPDATGLPQTQDGRGSAAPARDHSSGRSAAIFESGQAT